MFEDNLKLLLKMNNMTQKDLAAFLSVKPNTVSDWIRQGNSPKIEHLCRISEYFNVTLDWLLAGDGAMYRDEKNALRMQLLDEFDKLDENEKFLVLERIQTIIDLKKPPKNKIEHSSIKPTITKIPIPMPAQEPEPETRIIEIRVYDQRASAGLGSYLDGESTYEMLSVSEGVVPPKADFGIRIGGNSMEPEIPDNSIVWVKEQLQLESGQVGIFTRNNEEAFCKKLLIDQKKKAIFLVSYNPKYEPIRLSENDFLRTIGMVIGKPFTF